MPVQTRSMMRDAQKNELLCSPTISHIENEDPKTTDAEVSEDEEEMCEVCGMCEAKYCDCCLECYCEIGGCCCDNESEEESESESEDEEEVSQDEVEQPKERVLRGECKFCLKGVWNDQARYGNDDGTYEHKECYEKSVAPKKN